MQDDVTKPKKKRRGFVKSRNGCPTCKIRHVKCDETKPACRQCTSTGRVCDFPKPLPTPVSSGPPTFRLEHHDSISPSTGSSNASSSVVTRETSRSRALALKAPWSMSKQYQETPQSSDPYDSGASTGTAIDSYNSNRKSNEAFDNRVHPIGLVNGLPLMFNGHGVDTRAFCFFLERTVPLVRGFTIDRYWTNAVLPLFHSESLVQELVLALSNVHQSLLIPEQDTVSYLKYYNKALKLAVNMGEADLDILLLAIPLFVLVHDMTGNNKTAVKHITAYSKIVQDYERKMPASRRRSTSEIIEKFSRPLIEIVKLHFRLFGDVALLNELENVPVEECHQRQHQSGSSLSPPRIQSFHDARLRLHNIMQRHLTYLDSLTVPKMGTPQYDDLKEDLRLYFQSSNDFLDDCSPSEVPNLHTFGSKLRSDYDVFMVQVNCLDPFEELKFDTAPTVWASVIYPFQPLVEGFCQRVQTNDTIIESENEDFGYIAPLFSMVCLCRNSTTRRHALELLYKLRIHEGVWNSTLAGKIAESVIRIEERDCAGLVQSDALIPKESRIRVLSVDVDSRTGQGILEYIKWPYNKQVGPKLVEVIDIPTTAPLGYAFIFPLVNIFGLCGYQGLVVGRPMPLSSESTSHS